MESKQRIQHNTCMSSRGETKAGKKSNRFKKYLCNNHFTVFYSVLHIKKLLPFIMPFCCGKPIYIVCTYSCSSVVMIVIHIMQILMCLQRASKSSISVTCCCSFTNHFEVVKRGQQHSKPDSKANYTCNSSIQSDIPIHQSTNC